MKVFLFDLVPYAHQFTEFTDLPYPLPGKHFDPKIAHQTYQEHIEAWKLMDELGFDGVGFNEHHTTPHSLDELAEHADRGRGAAYKAAEIRGDGLSAADARSAAGRGRDRDGGQIPGGRVIAGLARGAPREYHVFSMPAKKRARVSRKATRSS